MEYSRLVLTALLLTLSPLQGACHTKVHEKIQPKVPFLCKAFSLPCEFLNLPAVVQKEIVKKLPTPFKPIRPQPQQLTHKECDFTNIRQRFTRIAISDDESLCAVAYNADRVFLTSLAGHEADSPITAITKGGGIQGMCFNKDATLLLIVMHRRVFLYTVENGKLTDQAFCGKAKLDKQLQVAALANGNFIIAASDQHIVLVDSASKTLTELNKAIEGDRYPPFCISTIHGEKALVVYRETLNPITFKVFDVHVGTWQGLHTIEAQLSKVGSEEKYGVFSLSADRTLIAVHERISRKLFVCNMRTENLHDAKALSLKGDWGACFSKDSSFLLCVNFGEENDPGEVLMYSVQTGAPILAFSSELTILGEYSFTPLRSFIVAYGCEGCNLFPWDPWWDECALFYNKPLPLLPYLFITYLHELGSCGLTLDQTKGVVPQQKYETRISPLTSPLSDEELNELVAIFQSMDGFVQKYLKRKYQLRFN